MPSRIPPAGRRWLLALLLLTALVLGGTWTAGYRIVVGSGDSMEPRFRSCDTVLIDVSRDEVGELRAGDVVAFRSGGTLLVHRIVRVPDTWMDDPYAVTAGDNNRHGDGQHVTSDQVVGVVVGHLDTGRVCAALGGAG